MLGIDRRLGNAIIEIFNKSNEIFRILFDLDNQILYPFPLKQDILGRYSIAYIITVLLNILGPSA
jgi:hypothetical protein